MKKQQKQVKEFVDKKKDNPFRVFYKHLVNGLTYMIPICVASGIIFAISYLIDTCCGVAATAKDFGYHTVGAHIFHFIGQSGLAIMFPILACFIARSIAGNRAIAPGLIGGLMTSNGMFSIIYVIIGGKYGWDYKGWIVPMSTLAQCASGFIGALFAGFIAGYIVILFANILKKMTGTWSIVRDFMLLPIITTFITTMSMFVLNGPLAFINIGINKALGAMLTVNGLIFLVAALVSALMCTDMGGPINKAAHFFCVSLVTDASLRPTGFTEQMAWQLMAANIVGIMVPPIGISISTWLFPKKYSQEDRLPSIGNCLIGFCGVTEPAIPYVAKDPVRVIGSCMLGAGVGGAVCYALGGQAIAPEGGTFSLITMGAICWKAILSTIIAAAITALFLGITKKNADPQLAKIGKWKGISIGNGIGFASVKNTIAEKVTVENVYAAKIKKLDKRLEAKQNKVSKEQFKKLVKKNIQQKAKLEKAMLKKLAKLDQRYEAYLAKKEAKKQAKLAKNKDKKVALNKKAK